MFNQHHPHHPHPPAPPPPPPPSHQQHFHQQMMQLHHLLHQQHRPLPHPGRGLPPPQPAPPPPHPPPPPPQPQMMNLRPTNRAALLNPNPVLQQALFMQHMQGNIRGFAIRPPTMQHFFTRATRHSILGTPSIGISMKPTRMGFPGLPFQQQNRMYYKDYHTGYDRKRELEPMSSSQARESEIKTTERTGADAPVAGSEAEHVAVSPAEPESQAESVSEDGPEPSAKRLKSLDEEVSDAEAAMAENQEEEEPDSLIRGPNGLQQCEADSICKQQNASVESSTIEMPSTGSSLKVTIQQRSESRAISTTAQKPGQRSSKGTNTAQPALDTGPRFFCYICKSNYHSQETFQYHMATAEHLRRLQEIQHLSDTCLVTFMPIAKENQVTGRDGRKHLQQRWCNACQIHFSGDLIQHRRTPEHKLAKHSLRPFCTVCSRHFKTPRKFVEHMKSPEHKQKAKEERFADKEPGGPEDAEELITVDAVGCFEDDEDEDEEEGIADEENADVVLFEDEECTTRTASVKEDTAQDCEEDEQYCVDTVYGPDFVVPVAGYLCRLCHKFYPSDSAARLAHCKSLMHFQNIQKHRAAKTQAQHESSSCPQDSGATLEDDSKLSLASSLDTENTSQGLGEERPTTEPSEVGDKASSSLREGAEDTDGGHCEKDWPDLKDDMQPQGTEEDGEEEEGADSLEQGDETQGPASRGTLDATEFLEEVSVAKDDTSASVRRRSSRRKNR